MATRNGPPVAPSAHPDPERQAARDISTVVVGDGTGLSSRLVVVSEQTTPRGDNGHPFNGLAITMGTPPPPLAAPFMDLVLEAGKVAVEARKGCGMRGARQNSVAPEVIAAWADREKGRSICPAPHHTAAGATLFRITLSIRLARNLDEGCVGKHPRRFRNPGCKENWTLSESRQRRPGRRLGC